MKDYRESTDFQAFVESIEDFVLVIDPHGQILFANNTVLLHLKYDLHQLVGMPLSSLHPLPLQGHIDTFLSDSLHGKTPLCKFQFLASDHSAITLEMRVSRGTWQGQDVLLAVGRDISHRLQHERLLLIQRDLAIELSTETQLDRALQLVLHTALDAAEMSAGSIYLVDKTTGDLRLACVSGVTDDSIRNTAQYDKASSHLRLIMQGKPIYTDHSLLISTLKDAKPQAELRAIATVPILHRGQVIGCLNVASFSRTTLGPTVRHVLETLASKAGSVIARLCAEEALRDSEEIARVLLNNPAEAALLLQQDGTILGINDVGAHYFGKTPTELLGAVVFDLFPPDIAAARRAQVNMVFASGQVRRFEDEWQETVFDNTISPLFDANGSVTRVAVHARDITAFKRNQETLDRQRTLFAGIAEATGVLLAMPDYLEAIKIVLALLGNAAQADHIYIYQNHPDPDTGEPAVSRRLWWENETIAQQDPATPQVQPWHWNSDIACRWYGELSAGHAISGLARDFPAAERTFLEANACLSLAVVPIFAQGKFWGFIGFDDCHFLREWSSDEITAVQTLATSIGSAIERHAAEENLRHEREISETLRDIGIALTATLDLNHVFDRLLVEIRRVVPYDAANVMLIRNGITSIVSSAGYDKFGLPRDKLDCIHFHVDATPHMRTMAATREPYICPNAGSDPDWLVIPHIKWIKSWMGGPIVARGEVVGFFSLDSATPGFYQQEHIRLIASIARLTAIAYENAQLFEDIRALESEKSDMIHMASHDLRSPVMRIQTILERFEDSSDMVSPEQRGDLAGIGDAARDIERILDEILSTERIEARHRAAEPIIWYQLIEHVAHSLQIEREEKSQTLEIACQPDLPVTRGDSSRLEHAVLNLLDNAIKYTPPSGHIVIRAFLKEYIGALKIAVEVQDDGIGIPAELQAKLFEPFYRARQPGTEATPGTGMGLSVVKAAVEYHHGRVYVDSTPCKGSLFGFWVPI